MTKRDRNWSTVSSDRVGRCAMSTCFVPFRADRYMRTQTWCGDGEEGLRDDACPPRSPTWWRWTGTGSRSLLGVVLHDELLLDRHVDLLAHRDLVDQDPHAVRQRLEPGR